MPELPDTGDIRPQRSPARRHHRSVIIGGLVALVVVGAMAAFAGTRGGGTQDAAARINAGATSDTNASAGEHPTSSVSSRHSGTATTAAPGATSAGGARTPTSAPGVTAPRISKLPSRFGIGGGKYAPGGTAPPIPTDAKAIDPTIAEAYTAAYRAECNKIWSIATDGKLWDPDEDPPRTAHTVQDCLKGLDPGQAIYAFDTSEAQQSGIEDADGAAADLTWFGVLQNTAGDRRWTAPS